jgi:hypothetical protein
MPMLGAVKTIVDVVQTTPCDNRSHTCQWDHASTHCALQHKLEIGWEDWTVFEQLSTRYFRMRIAGTAPAEFSVLMHRRSGEAPLFRYR